MPRRADRTGTPTVGKGEVTTSGGRSRGPADSEIGTPGTSAPRRVPGRCRSRPHRREPADATRAGGVARRGRPRPVVRTAAIARAGLLVRVAERARARRLRAPGRRIRPACPPPGRRGDSSSPSPETASFATISVCSATISFLENRPDNGIMTLSYFINFRTTGPWKLQQILHRRVRAEFPCRREGAAGRDRGRAPVRHRPRPRAHLPKSRPAEAGRRTRLCVRGAEVTAVTGAPPVSGRAGRHRAGGAAGRRSLP